MLISPWVDSGNHLANLVLQFALLNLRSTVGAVFQEPDGPFNTSQFELTSVASTVKTLFNLSSFLTKRDEWAGEFYSLLRDEPRDEADMPKHLPEGINFG